MLGLRTRGMEGSREEERQGRGVANIGGKNKKAIWEGTGGKEGGKLLRVHSTVLWKVAIKSFDEKCRPSKA